MKFHKVLLIFLILFVISCQKDEEVINYASGTNEYVNQWIYEQMKRYYYWNDALPNNVNLSLEPKEYFSRLVYENDPFSYIFHPSYSETFPQSLRSSYGFDIGFREYQGSVYGVILYTLESSPAKTAGLTRGLFIKSINGTTINLSNYNNLYDQLILSENAQLEVLSYTSAGGFYNLQQITINRTITLDQTISYKIIEKNNKKIGYIYIPQFYTGMAQVFIEVFNTLKDEQITDLVLDLRYNGGGDVSSATALCIALLPSISEDDLFIKFNGNKNGGTIYQSFKESLSMNESHINFYDLQNVSSAISKVYILCGTHTASASEIIINNLEPYIDVVTIGETTVGKDVAGFTIEDDRNLNEQGWILYPCIYKLFNANDIGNYSNGIPPTYMMDELQDLEVFPLGNQNETLLKKAINIITDGERSDNEYDLEMGSLKLLQPPRTYPILLNLKE